METAVYNQKGGDAGKITLPEHIFGLNWNSDLVHQVAVSMASNARQPIAHAKTRGEVRGGGKKPWQQKGTGRARHGSTRSPIWVGGGVTHGPRKDKNYARKVNRGMKAKALYTILSRKLRDGEVFFVDSLSMNDAKTKNAVSTLSTMSGAIRNFPSFERKGNALLIAFAKRDENIVRSMRNIETVTVDEVRNLNPLMLLQYKGIVLVGPKEAVAILESKMKVPLSAKSLDATVISKPARATRKATVKAKAKAKVSKTKQAPSLGSGQGKKAVK
jgi:large subunit ribosomal protein L4